MIDFKIKNKMTKIKKKSSNKNLHNASKNKKDEFYTQLTDIERELGHYKEHFKDKVIFLNCDDSEKSNFWKYFCLNFEHLRLKKLIATHFEKDKPSYKLEIVRDMNKDGKVDCLDTIKTSLKQNGDFRSSECIEILKEADIVVTNPPFSLFREFVSQLIEYNKKFLIIGHINAITYKEIFKLIKKNKAWLGINLGRGISGFIVPKHYKLYGTETKIDEEGNRIISPNNCLWLTNLDNSKRHKDINLTKIYIGNENLYPKYDNYEGINVNRTKDIPLDYKEAIGVPITFLHKFNPSQFEIIKFRKGSDEKDLSINGKCPYFRILIKNRRL